MNAGETRILALDAKNTAITWINANKCYNLFKMSLASLIRTIHRTHLCGRLKYPLPHLNFLGVMMASYEFWCETCKVDYVEERPMADSDKESICPICKEKAMRKYNINAIFKGPGFYSTDSKTKKAKK